MVSTNKPPEPPPNYIFIAPAGHNIGASAEDDVNVIGQFGMESDFHREETCEQLLGLLNPFTAVLIVATGYGVCSTKEGTLDTTIPAMIDADFTGNWSVLGLCGGLGNDSSVNRTH